MACRYKSQYKSCVLYMLYQVEDCEAQFSIFLPLRTIYIRIINKNCGRCSSVYKSFNQTDSEDVWSIDESKTLIITGATVSKIGVI